MYQEAYGILHAASAHDADGWEFDAFALARATGDHSLAFIGHFFLESEGLISHFGLQTPAVLAFLAKLVSGAATRGRPRWNRTPRYHS